MNGRKGDRRRDNCPSRGRRTRVRRSGALVGSIRIEGKRRSCGQVRGRASHWACWQALMACCRNGQDEYENGEPSAFERESRASRPSQRGRTFPRNAARAPRHPSGHGDALPSNPSRARDVRFVRDSVRRDVLRRRLSYAALRIYITPSEPFLRLLRSQPSCSSHHPPRTTTKCKSPANTPPVSTTMKTTTTTWTPTPGPCFLRLQVLASHPVSQPPRPPMTGTCARLLRPLQCTL